MVLGEYTGKLGPSVCPTDQHQQQRKDGAAGLLLSAGACTDINR